MAVIIGVRFKRNTKVYYFDPNGQDFGEFDGVILETSQGIEYAKVVIANKEVDDSEIVTPLKSIIRKASPKDEEQNIANLSQREYLVSNTISKVNEHSLVMKIVDAEYTFDRSKIMIYFTADGRIDFRDLVRDLASLFHMRIELRQIYERDDIKMRGALAICGRPCCCSTHLQDYEKVSIKMAKNQGLSLNPAKISGCCGRLMCCLKYENAHYLETNKRMPKIGSNAGTPDGEGLVISNDVLREQVKLKITAEDGSYEFKSYPLCNVKCKACLDSQNNDNNDNSEE